MVYVLEVQEVLYWTLSTGTGRRLAGMRRDVARGTVPLCAAMMYPGLDRPLRLVQYCAVQ